MTTTRIGVLGCTIAAYKQPTFGRNPHGCAATTLSQRLLETWPLTSQSEDDDIFYSFYEYTGFYVSLSS